MTKSRSLSNGICTWYLITSLDDYSRFMLYATLLKQQTSWTHITALESVFLRWGLPYTYYVDSHSIFRFVQGRDSFWRKHELLTDEADPQWKQVLKDCNVKVIYALSPQAKGKIERPYGWLQDRLIRTCVRENVTDIDEAQTILKKELYRYNYRQVHVKNAKPRQAVIVRMYPQDNGVTELRVWSEHTLLDVQRVKTDDLKMVHF